MRELFYEDETFKLEYIFKYDEVFIHCIVTDWKLSSFKKGLQVFGQLMNFLDGKGFKRILTVTPNPRFARLLGGKFIEKRIHEGKEYEVYQWVLK